MTAPIRPIVLSASAVAAAISTLAQTVHDHPGVRLTISDPLVGMEGADREAANMHRTSVKTAMVGAATEAQIRRNMGAVLPAVDFDPDSMHESWVRLSAAGFTGIINPGDTSRSRIGRTLGPNSDSTLNDSNVPSTTPGVVPCYTNCHSACHGSRGWR